MEFISDQQRLIVTSTDKYKLINGCAGSNKTDTLIKCAVVDLALNKRPILFLTLVGSVTDEIKTRLEKRLGIEICKQGISNHYVGYFEGVPVCISNYDAWVHLMLSDTDDLADIADCYGDKVNVLLAQTQVAATEAVATEAVAAEATATMAPMRCIMKNKRTVGLLMIDEAQDLRSAKMSILTNLSATHTDLDIYIAGDYLQTLYTDDSSDLPSLDSHAMNIFKRIGPTYFDLNICMRCPRAHVDFNNLLMADIQRKYMIPPMASNNDNTVDKPVLFTHLKVSDNTNARINAEQITHMIRVLMKRDQTIVPDDIAIIMGKSNDNMLYSQLEDTLSKLFAKRGFTDCVYHMSTHGDGCHTSLDWTKAAGKTKMLSIHGDKGRGHKVVFFVGLTEKSIPRESFLFKPSELIPESLLNVGLSRSLKYLFVGFTYNYASRYLFRHRDALAAYAYLAWEGPGEGAPEAIPEPYRSILACQPYAIPEWQAGIYKMEQTRIGSCSELQVKANLSKDYEQTRHLVSHPWKKEVTLIKFGVKQPIRTPLHKDHFLLLGLMTELLIQRTTHTAPLFALLRAASNPANTLYTDDERLLSCMYDVRQERNSLDQYFIRYSAFFKIHPELVAEIRAAVAANKNVLHTQFKTERFTAGLERFLSPTTPNRDLDTDCIWNVTLFHNQVTQKEYRPAVGACMGYFHEDLSVLHTNIETFIARYLVGNAIEYEQPLIVQGELTDAEMLTLHDTSKRPGRSLSGRFDIYDSTHAALYEIKASTMSDYSQQWLTQIVTYAILMEVGAQPVRTMTIVNILAGCAWQWEIPAAGLPTIEELIATKISKKYEWHEIETEALLRGIARSRSREA